MAQPMILPVNSLWSMILPATDPGHKWFPNWTREYPITKTEDRSTRRTGGTGGTGHPRERLTKRAENSAPICFPYCTWLSFGSRVIFDLPIALRIPTALVCLTL